MISGMEEYVTLKEFYNEIGVKYTEYTPDLGWNLYSEGKIEVEMVATKMENGNPCLMLDYEVPPRYNPGYIDWFAQFTNALMEKYINFHLWKENNND